MRVVMPGRILERHVGGNSTYTMTLARELRARGIEVSAMPYSRRASATAVLENFAALRSYGSGTVVHFTADTGPLWSVRAPSVVTVHGVASRWISTARRPDQERVWRGRVRRAIASTDRVVSVSQSGARDVAEIFGVERDSIVVIPHGVDTARFTTREPLSDDVRSRVPSEYLLYVGNVEPRKNLVELVAAVERDPNLPPLVVVGRPAWNYAEAMSAIDTSSRVHYLGFVEERDVVALMQRCAMFVFPSLYEGFGFPVVEALAAGAPVLTSSRGSLPEVSGPSYVIDDLSREGIGAGLTAALSDSEWLSRCRADGPAWARGFSWDVSARKHIAVYEGLMR